MEAQPDPIVQRFIPDAELVARAQRALMEDESPRERFVRQRWEHALGAARVAMDELREIWPSCADVLPGDGGIELRAAHSTAEELVRILDELDEKVLGSAVCGVLNGAFTTHEELDHLLGTEPSSTIPSASRERELLAFICENPGAPPPHMDSSSTLTAIDRLVQEGWLERDDGNRLHATSRALDGYPEFRDL